MSTRVSRQVKIGNKVIGGGAPVLVQSMLNAPAEDYEKNLEQTLALEKAGCEIVRMAVPNLEAVKVLAKLKENTKLNTFNCRNREKSVRKNTFNGIKPRLTNTNG